MGGEFGREWAEHNVSSDVVASRIVFDSGIPLTVMPLDQTLRVLLTEEDLLPVTGSHPIGGLLADQADRFWSWLQACIPKSFSPVRIERFRKKMCYLRSCWYRDLTGFLTIKTFAKRLEHFVRPLGKEKTPETSYREMNTNLRFAVEHSLLQIDSYGHRVYDWTHRRIFESAESQILMF